MTIIHSDDTTHLRTAYADREPVRVAELLVQAAGFETRLPYVVVRFGNVLRPKEVPQRSGVEEVVEASCRFFSDKSKKAAQ